MHLHKPNDVYGRAQVARLHELQSGVVTFYDNTFVVLVGHRRGATVDVSTHVRTHGEQGFRIYTSQAALD
jgi:hypothetical protein